LYQTITQTTHVRHPMKVTSRIRVYRDNARARHAFERALAGAATPSHRQELVALSRGAAFANLR